MVFAATIEPELDGSNGLTDMGRKEIGSHMGSALLDAVEERADSGLHLVDIGDHLVGQVSLDIGVDQLVEVEVRGVQRQEMQLDPVGPGLDPLPHPLGAVDRVAVEDPMGLAFEGVDDPPEEVDEHLGGERLAEHGEVHLAFAADGAHRIDAEPVPARRRQRCLSFAVPGAAREVVGAEPDLVEVHDPGALGGRPLDQFGPGPLDPLPRGGRIGLDRAPVGPLETESQTAQELAHASVG